jgi:hypothetical protein
MISAKAVFEIFLETGVVSAGAKWLEHELDHSVPTTVKVKNE